MFVYWIHLPEHTNIKQEGYIGVSENVLKRFKMHKNKSSNNHLKNALKNCKEKI